MEVVTMLKDEIWEYITTEGPWTNEEMIEVIANNLNKRYLCSVCGESYEGGAYIYLECNFDNSCDELWLCEKCARGFITSLASESQREDMLKRIEQHTQEYEESKVELRLRQRLQNMDG